MAAEARAYLCSTPSCRRRRIDIRPAVPIAFFLAVGALAALQAVTGAGAGVDGGLVCGMKFAAWPCLKPRRSRGAEPAPLLRLRGAGPRDEDGDEDLRESVDQADGDEKDPTAFNAAEEEMMSKIERLNLGRARADADKLEPVKHRTHQLQCSISTNAVQNGQMRAQCHWPVKHYLRRRAHTQLEQNFSLHTSSL